MVNCFFSERLDWVSVVICSYVLLATNLILYLNDINNEHYVLIILSLISKRIL